MINISRYLGLALFPDAPADWLYTRKGEVTPEFLDGRGGVPARTASFLREQGYLLDTDKTAPRSATYLDMATLGRLSSKVELVDYIEGSRGPLVKYGRWPNGAKSALSITGDLDALTLLDYATRLFSR